MMNEALFQEEWPGVEARAIAKEMRSRTHILEWQRSLTSVSNEYISLPHNKYHLLYVKSTPKDVLLSMRLTYSAFILNDSVEINPKKAGGAPVLAGTRFKVAQILGELADGKSVKKLASEFGLDLGKIVSLLRGMAIQLDRPFGK